MMLIYVDDILLTDSIEKFLNELMLALNKKFSFKFLGDVFLAQKFVGFSTLQLNQQKYVKDLLHKFALEASKNIKTPMKSSVDLSKLEDTTLFDIFAYRSLIGPLQ